MKKTNKFLVSIFFFQIFVSNANAQKFSLDTNYVEYFKNKIVVVLFNSVQYNSIDLFKESKDSAAVPLSYPTYRSSFGLTLTYRFLTFSIGTNAVNFIMSDKFSNQISKIGKTKITNYAFTYNPNRFRFEFYYRKILGFHEENRALYDPNFSNNSTYYQFKNMQSVSYGADIFWAFNGRKRFSFGAPYSYSSRQKKSAGSFMFYFSGNRFTLESPNAFLPSEVAAQYGVYGNLTKFDGACLSWGAGYGYTISIGKAFYINAILVGRVPFMWKHFETSTGTVTDDFSEPDDPSIIAFAIGRASLGFNMRRFFIASYLFADMYDYSYVYKGNIDMGLKNKNIRGSIVFGMRFNKPSRKVRSSI